MASPKPSQIIEHLCDALSPLGVVAPRSMFGGWGLYLDEVMFGLVHGDEAYFRADDATSEDYEALGLTRFKPWADKPTTMPYYPVPPDVFDDPDLMLAWAERALGAARRARANKRSGGK